MKIPLLQSFIRAGHFQEVAYATSVSLVLKVAGACASFLLSLIIARRFGAEGSGIYGLASTILMIAAICSTFGLDYTSVAAIAGYRAKGQPAELRAWAKTATLVTVGLGLAFTLLLWLGSERLAHAFGGSAMLAETISFIVLATIPFAATRLFASYLRGMSQFVRGCVIDPFLVPTTLAVLLVALPIQKVSDLAILNVCGTAFVALLGFFFWHQTLGTRTVPSQPLMTREAFARGLPVWGTLIGSFSSHWITILCTGALASEAEAGIYRVVSQFALLLAFVLQAAETGMSPTFAKLFATNNLPSIASASRRMAIILTVVGGLPAIVMLVFAEDLMRLFGPEFVAGADAMRVYVVAQVIVVVLGPVGSIMIMTGLGHLSFRNSVAGVVLVSILSLLLIPKYGATGATIAAASAVVFRAAVATIVVWRIRGLFLPLGLTRQLPHSAAS